MLERIIAAIVNVIAWVFIRQAERGSTATDADADPTRMSRLRRRLRGWVRKQDGPREGGRPDPDRAGSEGSGVREDWKRVEAQRE